MNQENQELIAHYWQLSDTSPEIVPAFTAITEVFLTLIPAEQRDKFLARIIGCKSPAELERLFNGTLTALFQSNQELANESFIILELTKHLAKKSKALLPSESFALLTLGLNTH